MHFRKISSIILREFVANVLGRQPKDIFPGDILWYVSTIRAAKTRGGLLDTVNCIFNADPKSNRIADLVGGRIRRTTPLLNALYDDQNKFANKPIDLIQTDFDVYHIQRNNWIVRSNIPFFRPTAETIANVLRVQYSELRRFLIGSRKKRRKSVLRFSTSRKICSYEVNHIFRVLLPGPAN